MPFVMQPRKDYLPIIEQAQRRTKMNWIFEAYSNVYNAALMQDTKQSSYVAPANKVPATGIARLFGRR
jgi:hypothetical protein